jgi:molecular chaperone GrpE
MNDSEMANDTLPAAAGAPEASEAVVRAEPASLSAEELAELKERAARTDEYWDRLLRTTADLENYRKRAAREKQEASRLANEPLLRKLIPVLDSLELALGAAQTTPVQAAALHTGIQLVHQQLKNALVEAGLEEIDAAGKAFDPNLHLAVSQHETADAPEGQVLQQLLKGYRFRDRLLRPASVVVAKHPAA